MNDNNNININNNNNNHHNGTTTTITFHFQASNRYVRIYSNGDVFYSERIALDVSCPMKFHKLPFDTQVSQLLDIFADLSPSTVQGA